MLKNKKILILGGGVMQIPLIQCAKKNGACTVVMDQNPDALGCKMADFTLLASIGDVHQAVKSTLDFLAHHQRLDAVLTVGTDFSLMVATLAQRFNLPGTSVLTAQCCTNKKKMRETLRDAGLFQPLYLEVKASDLDIGETKKDLQKQFEQAMLKVEKQISKIGMKSEISCSKNGKGAFSEKLAKNWVNRFDKKDDLDGKNKIKNAIVQRWQDICGEKSNHLPTYPAVLKPVDSMGARGVIKVQNATELKENLENVMKFSPSQCILIEQFLIGEGKWQGELSIDALVFHNEITITGVADRMIAHAPYFVEDGHIIPSQRPKDVVLASIEVFKKAIKAVNLQHGAAKADIILTNHTPVVGEIAARLSGGFMSGYTYPLSSGVDLMQKMLLVACGISPKPFDEKPLGVVLEHALYAQGSGVIKNISGVEEARSLDGVQYLFIHVKKGSIVKNPQNNLMKCGNIIILAPNADKAKRVAQKVQEVVRFEL